MASSCDKTFSSRNISPVSFHDIVGSGQMLLFYSIVCVWGCTFSTIQQTRLQKPASTFNLYARPFPPTAVLLVFTPSLDLHEVITFLIWNRFWAIFHYQNHLSAMFKRQIMSSKQLLNQFYIVNKNRKYCFGLQVWGAVYHQRPLWMEQQILHA